jgi:hypothetical protein
MESFEVTYYLTRKVTISVTVQNGDDPREYTDDELTLNEGEEILDIDVEQVGTDEDEQGDY